MTADRPDRPAATPDAASAGGMPPPDARERAHSERLSALIRAAIVEDGGLVSFERFMELALYAPGLGYYSAGREKFGAHGDFVTAPELGTLFTCCLARQCAQVLESIGDGDILEAGAGSGALAADLLLALEALGRLPRHYLIIELSSALRAQQAARLRATAAHLLDRVTWVDRLPPAGFQGVVLGNELLDALPVRRFRVRGTAISELGVGVDGDRFAWRETPADPALASVVRARLPHAALSDGYTSEINLAAEAWVRSVADLLARGALLLFDYGFPRHEYYHPDRTGGTLMCHYRHRAHPDPLILVGLQDITAHIDFTAVAEAGQEAGLTVSGYTSQAAFLVGAGLEACLADAAGQDTRAQLTLAQQAKKLTLPHEMGELFKVIALTRAMRDPLRGFALHDRRGRL